MAYTLYYQTLSELLFCSCLILSLIACSLFTICNVIKQDDMSTIAHHTPNRLLWYLLHDHLWTPPFYIVIMYPR